MDNKKIFFGMICWFFLFGCVTTSEQSGAFPPSAEPNFFAQNMGVLHDSNGKVVKSNKLNVNSRFTDQVDCYEIKYLSDSLKVVGFLIKPKEDSLKYPVIIFNRGGNREFGKITEKILQYLSFLSSRNYVVLASQYRGNDGGQGEEEFGGNDVNDVLNLIELAKSLPFVDSSKISMLGFSRGGMMTYIAIKRGADIKGAAVVGAPTDIERIYYEREKGMEKVIETLVGMDKNEWEKRSAVYWPGKIDVPILIMHGENDRRVKVSHAKNLAEKLQMAEKDYKLVIVPGGNHGLSKHMRLMNKNILNWFNKYLQ